jgi:hypothetical protein
VGRANWLFADTVFSAKVNAMMYSVVETAKANHVHVRYYLQYLFEEITKYLDQSDKSFLKDMVPWSDSFHRYELQKDQTDEQLWHRLFPEPERPRTQGKGIQWFIHLQRYIKMMNYQLTVRPDKSRSFPRSNRFQGSSKCFGF